MQRDFLNDHAIRSQLVYELITSPQNRRLHAETDSGIPKRVIQFWDDLARMPDDVRECINSWHIIDGLGYSRELFDDAYASDFIGQNFDVGHLNAYDRCHHPAMRCDYFRLCFLLKNGGAYIDADEQFVGDEDLTAFFETGAVKLQPLCFDMSTGAMVPASRFIHEPFDRHRIYYFNNNPILARKDDAVIAIALQRATNKLLSSARPQDIQATTGPGNITESLLLSQYGQDNPQGERPRWQALSRWDDFSVSKWPLSYRDDNRNWRNWELPE
ncbi:glycosyltransferase [Crateriforma spongiae]|uniref:glycosyltransferase n=1 Tax=Crateriforma spongiae TaxID=2724528 RepID=UPI0039AF82F7